MKNEDPVEDFLLRLGLFLTDDEVDDLKQLVRTSVEAEREACAAVCDHRVLPDEEGVNRAAEGLGGERQGVALPRASRGPLAMKLATDLPAPPAITAEDRERLRIEATEWALEFRKKVREMENLTPADWATRCR